MMKVATLIERLQKEDPEATVLIPDFYDGASTIRKVAQKQYEEGVNKGSFSGPHDIIGKYAKPKKAKKAKKCVVLYCYEDID